MSKKVLIVEDDRILRGALKIKLSNSDYEVLEAPNGEEGYQKIVEESPDAILLDIEMPRMDGIEVLQKMKKNLIDTNNIIMLTNVDDSKHLADAMELGITTYLIKKDYTLDRIVEEIEKVSS